MPPEDDTKRQQNAELDRYLQEIEAARKRRGSIGTSWAAIRRGDVARVESASGVIYKGR